MVIEITTYFSINLVSCSSKLQRANNRMQPDARKLASIKESYE